MGYTVDYRETLVVYLRSDSLEQAAQTLKIAPGTLYSRIMHMKKHGVKVPLKATRLTLKNDLFIAQLNSLINKHNS